MFCINQKIKNFKNVFAFEKNMLVFEKKYSCIEQITMKKQLYHFFYY